MVKNQRFSLETLNEMRLLSGVTLTELGTWTGINPSRACLFFRGQHELREEQKVAIFNALFQAVQRRVAAVDRMLARINEPALVEIGGRGS
jgi:hypothetical protein